MGTEGRHQIPNGKTLLMIACEQGRSLDVKILLQKKPLLVASRDRSGKTALHYCAETGSVACAQQILCADASLIQARDKDGYTPLHLAVIAGNRHMVKFLLKRGADANSVDKERHSCVHWATVCGDLDTLEILLNHGATPSTADMLGAYPIHYAAQMCGPHSLMGNDTRIGVATLRKLIRCGAPIHCRDRDGREPILWAASAGSSEAVLLLFTAGANISTADKDGLTALHCAASRGHTGCVETLVTLCGAGVNVGDTVGCSPLFYAAAQGHADASQTLLKYGADPNLQDHKGRTPGHCAATKGQLETIRILDSNGADLWIRNSRGNLPLHEAVQCGRKDLVQWLLQQNPPAVNATNISGRTPLHIAAQSNNVEMCEVLIDYGAYINPLMVNPKGFLMTPLDAAVHQGNQRCAKYVQLHGGVLAKKVLENNGINRNLLYSLGNYAARRKDQDDDVASVTSGENRAVRPSTVKIEAKDEASLQPQVSSPPPSPTDSVLTNVRSESADASVHIHLSREDLWSLWESFMHSEVQSEERGESECSCGEDHRMRGTAESTHRLKPALVTNVYLTSARRKNNPEVTETKDTLLQLPKEATGMDSSEAPESSQASYLTRTLSISATQKEVYVSKKNESLESLPATSLPSTIELQRLRNSDSVQLDREERSTYSSDISGVSIVRKNEVVEDSESSVGSDTAEVLLAKKQKMAKLRKKRSDGRPEGREIIDSETSSGLQQADQKERFLHARKLHQKPDRSPENRLSLYREKHRHGNSGNIRGAVSYEEKTVHTEANQERNFTYAKQNRTMYSRMTEQRQTEMQPLRTQRSSRHDPDNLTRGGMHTEPQPHFANVLPQYEELVKQTTVTGDHHLHYHHHHHHHHYHHVHEEESRDIANPERDLSNASISGAQEIDERSQRAKHRQSRKRFKLNWKPKLHRGNHYYRTRRHKSDNEFYSRERYERIKTKDVVRSKSEVCMDRRTRSLVMRESTESLKAFHERQNFRAGISEVPSDMEENVEPNEFVTTEVELSARRQHPSNISTEGIDGKMYQEHVSDNKKHKDRQLGGDLQDRLGQSTTTAMQDAGSEYLAQNLSDSHSRNTQFHSSQEISALTLDNRKGVSEKSAEHQRSESRVHAVLDSGDNLASEDKKLPDNTMENPRVSGAESPNGKLGVDGTTESDEDSSSENDYTVRENVSLHKMDNFLNGEINDRDMPMMETSEDEAIGMDEIAQSTDDGGEKDALQHLENTPANNATEFKDFRTGDSDVISLTKEHSSPDKSFEGDEKLSSKVHAAESRPSQLSDGTARLKRDGSALNTRGTSESLCADMNMQTGENVGDGTEHHLNAGPLPVGDSLTEDSETISSETSVEGERRKEVMSGRKSRLGRPYSKHSRALLRNSAKSEPIPESGTEDLSSIKDKKPATATTTLRTPTDSISLENKKSPSPSRTDREQDQMVGPPDATIPDGKKISDTRPRENAKPKDSGTTKDGGKTASPKKTDNKVVQKKSAEIFKRVARRLSSPKRDSIKSAQKAEMKANKKDGNKSAEKYDSQPHAKKKSEETDATKKISTKRSDAPGSSRQAQISSTTRDSTSVAESEVLQTKDSSVKENVRNKVLSQADANEKIQHASVQGDLSPTEQREQEDVRVISVTKDTASDFPQMKQSGDIDSDIQEHRTEIQNDVHNSTITVNAEDDKNHERYKSKRSAEVKDKKHPDSSKSKKAKDNDEESQIRSSKDGLDSKAMHQAESASNVSLGSSENISNEGDEIKIIITPDDSETIATREDASVPVEEEETAFSSDDTYQAEPQADIRYDPGRLSPEDAVKIRFPEEKIENRENQLSGDDDFPTNRDEELSESVREREVNEHEERIYPKSVKDRASGSGEELKEGTSISETEFLRKEIRATKRKSLSIKRSVPRDSEHKNMSEDHNEQRPNNHVIEDSHYSSEKHQSSEYTREFTDHRDARISQKTSILDEELYKRIRRNSALELHGKTSKPSKHKLFPAVIHKRRASVPRDSFLSSTENLQKAALNESKKTKSEILTNTREKHLTSKYTEGNQSSQDRSIRRDRSTDNSGRSESADPVASVENNEQHDSQKYSPRDGGDFSEQQSRGQDTASLSNSPEANVQTSKSKGPELVRRTGDKKDSEDHNRSKNFTSDGGIVQDNDDSSYFTEVNGTELKKSVDDQRNGDKESVKESPTATSFIVHIDQKRRVKKRVQNKSEDSSKVASKSKADPSPDQQSKKKTAQKTAQDAPEADELTVFCNSMLSADQDRITPPPSNFYAENKPQKYARYSYTNLEKPGFLWVHFGSGSSPTKNGKARPMKDFKRFKVEKKTTKTQITPKDNNNRASSGKATAQKRKSQDAKKERSLRSGKRANAREPERKIPSYIKQKEITFTKLEKKKEERSSAKKKFAGRTNLKKEEPSVSESENTAKGGNLPPKKTYPTRIPAARGVNKFSKEKNRNTLPQKNEKDSQEKKRDLSDKQGDKERGDDEQKPPTTSESSSLGEGDLRLTVERKTNPEISIKIKVSDTSPKRSEKTRAKPSEDKKKKIVEQSDLSASLSESGYSSLKDSSGYVSTVESIYQNRRNITIDVGNNKAKINTAVSFPTSDDPGDTQIHGAKICKDSKIPVEDKSAQTSGSSNVQSSVHSVVIDVGTNFAAQKIFHHDNLHQIPPPKRESDTKTTTPCPLDGLYERMSTDSESGSVHPKDDGTTADVVPWPKDVDAEDLPTALDKLMDPMETPTKSISVTESTAKTQQNDTETSEGVESIKEEHSEKGSLDHEESVSEGTETIPKDVSQTLPPSGLKKKSVPKFTSKIPPPRTYSESSLQSLLMRTDYKTQIQSRSMPTLNEKQVRKFSRISRPTADFYKRTNIKEKKSQAEDAVSRFPAIHPSRTGKISKNSIKPPLINFQTESSVQDTTMPRITVDQSQDTRRIKGETATALPSVGQYLKLPILQQPVRCKCTILPQEQLDKRRTKSAVECIANVHFLTDEQLAKFEERSRTSHRRILKREEISRPSFHPLRYKALRTQTLKYLRAGQTTKDRQPMITFHVDHDKERNTFKLPTSKLNENKKWQVVFTIGKTDEVTEDKADASKK